MTKLVGLFIAAAAFVVALCLVLRRRDAPRAGGRFALLVAGFVALLGGCRTQESPKRPARTGPPDATRAGAQGAGAAKAGAQGAGAAKAGATKAAADAKAALAGIRKRWLGVPQLKDVDYDKIKPTIAAQQAACAKELELLVEAKTISARGAAAFNQIYGDRIYHQLRQRAATCYDPTTLGFKVQLTRAALEKRLKLLAGLRVKGTLKPAVQQKVERGLKRQMELLLRAKACWDKQAAAKKPDWHKLRAEEQAILAFYVGSQSSNVAIKDMIKVRPGLEQAMGLIAQLYN